MICPSCGYDNIEGVDRCDECMTPLRQLDVPLVDTSVGLARSVMQNDLRQLGQEFLGFPPDAPVSEVIQKMQQNQVGCALVLSEGKLVGIFTERDLLKKMTGKSAAAPSTAVRDLMSPDPEVLRETDSIATAVNKMSMGHYRHIPVIKADGSYSVTSIKHVLKYLAREQW